jgi:hypothetical protein
LSLAPMPNFSCILFHAYSPCAPGSTGWLLADGSSARLRVSHPPENYKGPISEQPVIQQGDYWIYERGDLTRAKSTGLISNLHFPLWIGKTWRYNSGAHRPNQPPTSTTSPIPAWVECYVIAFRNVTVPAGTFGARIALPS